MHAGTPRLCSFLSIVIGGLSLIVALIGEERITQAHDESISIGSITVNPHESHRRAVTFKGTAKNIRIQNGSDAFGQRTCGQAFDLEDGTGTIEIWYIIKCYTADPPTLAGEGELVIVSATIEAPPTNIKTSSGKDLGIRAMATKVVRIAP